MDRLEPQYNLSGRSGSLFRVQGTVEMVRRAGFFSFSLIFKPKRRSKRRVAPSRQQHTAHMCRALLLWQQIRQLGATAEKEYQRPGGSSRSSASAMCIHTSVGMAATAPRARLSIIFLALAARHDAAAAAARAVGVRARGVDQLDDDWVSNRAGVEFGNKAGGHMQACVNNARRIIYKPSEPLDAVVPALGSPRCATRRRISNLPGCRPALNQRTS